MLYADFRDVVYTVGETILFGFAMGIYSVLLSSILFSVENFVLMPKRIYQSSKKISDVLNFRKIEINSRESAKNKGKMFFDFLYVLSYGIFFKLFTYVATDGIFRLHILLISLGTTYVFYLVLGQHARILLMKLINFICSLVTMSFCILILPVRKILNGIALLNNTIFKKILSVNKNKRFANFVRKKKSCAK